MDDYEQCTFCGKGLDMGDAAYIGPADLDEEDPSCSPFQEFIILCHDCYADIDNAH